MKNHLIGLAFVFASAVAFAVGDITAAKSAADDIGSAIGRDPATGLPYLRVFVVNAGGQLRVAAAPAVAAQPTHSVTLTEGSSVPVDGTLTSATATGRPCDLIIFENGQSQIILTSPTGTSLKDLHVTGTVSASGNPFGYSCSIVLKYRTP
ncbi:MAG: hypothetical protein WAL67_04050 [Candidatus Cybelea sp.]